MFGFKDVCFSNALSFVARGVRQRTQEAPPHHHAPQGRSPSGQDHPEAQRVLRGTNQLPFSIPSLVISSSTVATSGTRRPSAAPRSSSPRVSSTWAWASLVVNLALVTVLPSCLVVPERPSTPSSPSSPRLPPRPRRVLV